MSKYVITYRYEGTRKIWKNKIYDTKEKAKNDLVRHFWDDKINQYRNGRIKKIL